MKNRNRQLPKVSSSAISPRFAVGEEMEDVGRLPRNRAAPAANRSSES